MQAYIPSGSPLMQYGPCRWCPEGWTNGDLTGRNLSGADPGWYTTAQTATVMLNFTGTGVKFNMEFASPPSAAGSGGSPGGGGASGVGSEMWSVGIKVNGTDAEQIGGTSKRSLYGIIGLVPGHHSVEMTLTRTDGSTNETNWARVNGATGTMSSMPNPLAKNATIDDTQWANNTIDLTSGWNMMEDGHSNWLNETAYNIQKQNATLNFNNSLSWTDQVDASMTIHFTGSALWLIGSSGAEAGQFEVLIDNQSQGTFDAEGGPKVYNQVLYMTSGLKDVPHNLTLVNKRGRLSVDYVNATTEPLGMSSVVSSTTLPQSATPALALPSSRASSSASVAAATAAASKHGENTKMIIGASVGAIVGLLLLALVAFLIWSACRRRKERSTRHAPRNEWDEAKPWYRKALGTEKGWRFIDLPDKRIGSDLGHGAPSDGMHLEQKPSGSSFGSSAATTQNSNALSVVPPAHTRRSLLPFRNNLWAKEKARPASGVDPMLAALGGVASPLENLQRTCSVDSMSVDNQHGRVINGAAPKNFKKPGSDDGDELLVFEDMPQVGSSAWYQVFGLGPPGANRQRSSRLSGLSNIFRRSATPSVQSANSMDQYQQQQAAQVVQGHHVLPRTAPVPPPMRLDPRALGGAAMATGAEERSPRRRFFGAGTGGNTANRLTVDSVWARY